MSNQPYEWSIAKLGDIAKTTSGGTPSRRKPDYYGGDIPWFKSGELNDGLISVSDETITKSGLDNSNCKLYPVGTLLMAMYGATVGKLGILQTRAATNQAICAIFPSGKVDRYYLFWFLRFKAASPGSAGRNRTLGLKKLERVLVPVPTYDEQQRFLEIAKRRQLIQLETAGIEEDTRAFIAALLAKAFQGEL